MEMVGVTGMNGGRSRIGDMVYVYRLIVKEESQGGEKLTAQSASTVLGHTVLISALTNRRCSTVVGIDERILILLAMNRKVAKESNRGLTRRERT